MLMRHHRRKKSRVLRQNPLKPKILLKRVERLRQLGLPATIEPELLRDLAATDVDPANAIYVLDWWEARLCLLLFISLQEKHEESKNVEGKLLEYLQQYAKKYTLSMYDLALDGELQIDYWASLQHFIQMSGANPYFKAEWPVLHRVMASLTNLVVPTQLIRYAVERGARTAIKNVIWLGKLVNDNITLSDSRIDYEAGAPAIKLLRGKYMGDPPNEELQTELPKEAISSIEKTFKPSDVIAFLKDAEENLQTSIYFIPKYHQPFYTFPDGKVWAVVGSEDVEDEKKSLGDCAAGEYTHSSIIVISLREPVATSPKGTFYRTRLRAEIIFPRDIAMSAGSPAYENFSKSTGVINQLRGYANSKPNVGWHPYIMPLLSAPWIGHLTRPAYRPDDVFWFTDLSEENFTLLQAVNPRLFDTMGFYQEMKNLDFPSSLATKITEGLEFPTSYIIQLLTETTYHETLYHRSPNIDIVTRSLKRRLKDRLVDPQLQELLVAAEDAITRLRSEKIASQFEEVGLELSTTAIQAVLEEQALLETTPPQRGHLLDLACRSLRAKLSRGEPGLETLEELVRKLLLLGPIGRIAAFKVTGVSLRPDQIEGILKEIVPENNAYLFKLAMESLANADLIEDTQKMASILSILESLVLNDMTPYAGVESILGLNLLELTEKQICDLLSKKDLHPGPTLAAFVSLKQKVDKNTLQKPKRTLEIATKAMFRIKDRPTAEAAMWVEIPINSIIKVLRLPNLNREVKNAALAIIQRKMNNGDKFIRNQVFTGLRNLLFTSKTKGFIQKVISMYAGHQQQARLFHQFMLAKIDWLTEENNIGFFLRLIEETITATDLHGMVLKRHPYESHLSEPLYRILQQIVTENLVPDNISFFLKILFRQRFDSSSQKRLGSLLEMMLDKIIKDPQQLTRSTCNWYQEEAMVSRWGRTSTRHKGFVNTIPLTPKLLRQFKALLRITIESGNDCYLDLAVTIGSAMGIADRRKLYDVALPLFRSMFTGETARDYMGYIQRLIPRRARRYKKR